MKFIQYILSLGTTLTFFLFAGCNNEKVRTAEIESLIIDLDQTKIEKDHLNINVTVRGMAQNAKQGAVITGTKSWVFVENLDQWSASDHKKKIEISGVIYEKTFPAKTDSSDITPSPTGTFDYIKPNNEQRINKLSK